MAPGPFLPITRVGYSAPFPIQSILLFSQFSKINSQFEANKLTFFAYLEIFYKRDRSVGFEKKFDNCVFFQGSSETQLARSFSWPYVEPPSKSATTSNDKSSDDDTIGIETSEIVQIKNWQQDIII